MLNGVCLVCQLILILDIRVTARVLAIFLLLLYLTQETMLGSLFSHIDQYVAVSVGWLKLFHKLRMQISI